jgi:hypothetical protein
MACRLCTANDCEALIEDLAAKFWEGERDDPLDGRTRRGPATIGGRSSAGMPVPACWRGWSSAAEINR